MASVLEQCEACIAGLKNIVSTLSNLDSKKARAHHDQVNDELERFSLWMGNIGALNPPESPMSLESRLREANSVLTHILELLDDLSDVTGEFLAIISGERQGKISEDQSEETELLEEIGACITRLFRVSNLIRQAAPTDLFAKSLSRTRYRFNDQFDIAHVGEKYPKLATEKLAWLQNRLGRAITQRRHYLSYIQDHRDKLEGMLTHKEIPEPIATKSQGPIEHSTAIEPLPDSSSRPSTFFTKASSLTPGHITSQMLTAEEDSDSEDDARSCSTISRSIDGDLDSSTSSRIPRLDELRTGSKKQVECPFCFRMKKFKNERVWRRHVFSDLRSYVCTFPGCDVPYFGDINEWFNHEMQSHRVSYTCPFCQSKKFQLKERYVAHVRKNHPDILEDGEQQPVIDIARKSLDQIPAHECPCCSEWVNRLKERASVSSIHSDASNHIINVVPAVFKRHLASHLEQLALFAIPLRSTEGDVGSNVAIEEDISALSGLSDLPVPAFDNSRPPSPASKGQSSDGAPMEVVAEEAASTPSVVISLNDQTPSEIGLSPYDSIPYPAFLRLNKTDIRGKFADLEWEQRERAMQSMQPNESEQPSQWARCTGDEVMSRNRYANVDPYQRNRVKLKVPEGHNDYINASPIILESAKSKIVTKFIATQGPKPDTFSHIWRMVWDETSSPAVIVMLTQSYEGGREKCSEYFPQSISKPNLRVNEHDEFEDGLIHNVKLVSLVNNEEARSVVRELEMTSDDESESKKIWHILFSGWPDFSIPEGADQEALLKLIDLSREKNANNSTNPRIVHCSAGIGRTGTFIALDWLLQELEKGSLDELSDDQDPVFDTVHKLRQQRMMMVQGEQQFLFIYDVIRERWRERWIKRHPEDTERQDAQIVIGEPERKKHRSSRERNVSESNMPEDEGLKAEPEWALEWDDWGSKGMNVKKKKKGKKKGTAIEGK